MAIWEVDRCISYWRGRGKEILIKAHMSKIQVEDLEHEDEKEFMQGEKKTIPEKLFNGWE